MRCINMVRDDLHDYAEAVLASMETYIHFDEYVDIELFGGFQCIVLQRSGNMQVEYVGIGPNVVVPPHSHPGVDSIDLLVKGSVSLTVGDLHIPRPIKRLGVRIGQNVTHSGVAGADGVRFLSCQRWNRKPDFIARSWIGEPVSDKHARLIDHLQAVA